MTRWLLAPGLALALASVAPAADPAPPKATPEAVEFFEKKVRPLLAEHCYSCHGPKKQSAGLRLDTAAGVKAGADNGPVVTGGDPAKSRLVVAVRRQGDFPMPPKSPLPDEAVAALTEWVKIGAPYPEDAGKLAAGPDPKTHWAFQPLREPAVPELRNPNSAIHNPIDSFVLARLSDKGLSPAPRADKRTLIRRACFDLLGLPPTADEIDAFEKDASPDAWEKLIDRLLTSPHYGERWARHWLDVARYSDTKGYVFQEERNFPYAYTYRDYVIRSFNQDKPYDRFVVEQLAADKLPLGADRRPLAAMGFLTLGRRFLNNPHDIIDDRIDVVTRGLMGLTVTCARCHDHKFDPIPLADYYSLYGVFASSVEPKELPLIGEVKRTPEVVAFEAEVKKREAELQAETARRHDQTMKKLRSADGIADYIRAVLDSRGMTIDQRGGFVRERELSRYVFDRWKDFLAVEAKTFLPVFRPLQALAAIPEAEFAKKAPELIAGLGKDPKKPVNPLVTKALADANPKTLREAVEVYGKLIAAQQGADEPTDDQAELLQVLGKDGPLDIPLADFDKIQNRADRDQLRALQKKIDAFKATSPAAPPRAMVLNDTPSPVEPAVFLRGNPANHGPVVPRQFLAVAAGTDRKPFQEGSGRLELARAIASADNPLTARVFVNRVWIGHFGQGLVRTPSDFGVRSDPPTHPELLDWLARRFVQDGWSVKRLHKTIMLSATYQQASTASPELARLDPDNRLLARQTRRRLDFEAMRDGLLSAAGRLDPTLGGRPVDLFKAPFSTRRTVYAFIDRQNLPGTFRAFDFASPDHHSPQRFQTTVAPQALFLMNSPFVAEQARAVVARPEVVSSKATDERITRVYRAVFGRTPTSEELAIGREFVAEPEGWFAGAIEGARPIGKWAQYAQVLLLSNEFAFVD
jgi:hypothetical protein